MDDIDNKDKVWNSTHMDQTFIQYLILYDTFGHKADPKEMGK
jgi:hypothetical protein